MADTALETIAAEIAERSGGSAWYIFWNTRSASGKAPPQPARERHLLAFASPDAALAFAQRNGMAHDGKPPRLRRLAILQLVQAMLREPAIISIILAHPEQEPTLGNLPDGIVITREAVLRKVQGDPPGV
jgi:hypothetical protein